MDALMRVVWMKCCWLGLFLVFMAWPLGALEIVGFSPARHALFVEGWGTERVVPNAGASFVGAGLDFSGVGWSGDGKGVVALVSDRFLVHAVHRGCAGSYAFFSPALGKTVRYWVGKSRKGGKQFAAIHLGGDVMLRPIFQDEACEVAGLNPAHGISPFPVAVPQDGDAFVGREVLVLGHGGGRKSLRLGLGKVRGFGPLKLKNMKGVVAYDYGLGGVPGAARAVSGDSGGPSFVRVGERLALVGVHLATSADSFLAAYAEKLSKVEGVGLLALQAEVRKVK